MITRELQQAADDLAVVELALICIYEALPERLPTPLVAKVHPEGKRFKVPHLPRCSEIAKMHGRPCINPAVVTELGLCGSHFTHLLGHAFRWDYQYHNSTCKLCGLTNCLEKGHPAYREHCPKRVLSERAKAILAEKVSGKAGANG